MSRMWIYNIWLANIDTWDNQWKNNSPLIYMIRMKSHGLHGVVKHRRVNWFVNGLFSFTTKKAYNLRHHCTFVSGIHVSCALRQKSSWRMCHDGGASVRYSILTEVQNIRQTLLDKPCIIFFYFPLIPRLIYITVLVDVCEVVYPFHHTATVYYVVYWINHILINGNWTSKLVSKNHHFSYSLCMPYRSRF